MLLILVLLAATGIVFAFAAREWGVGLDQNAQLASRSALADVEQRAASPFTKFDVWLRRSELGKKLEVRMARAGLEIPVAVFVAAMTIAALAAVIFVGRILAPVFGVLSIGLVAFLFFSYLQRQEDRRKEEFITQLPELARVLSNATQAGLALPTAIAMAAEELDDPAGSELRRAAQSMRVGQSFDAAIEEMRQRMPSREIGVLISTLLIASRSGGALVTALRNISDTLEARKETRREVKTILGETVSTAWAMLFMGVGSLFLINMLNPGVVRTMTESAAGIVVLVLAGTLLTAGFLGIRRITRIDL
ncbi:MAG: type II secretion system F family protein [Nocardiopsaceae bacterium]|nr:type II secretion system F family protein [Nocardiopsaceae bacterium]